MPKTKTGISFNTKLILPYKSIEAEKNDKQN